MNPEIRIDPELLVRLKEANESLIAAGKKLAVAMDQLIVSLQPVLIGRHADILVIDDQGDGTVDWGRIGGTEND
jgi:hypothetical protein